MTRSAPTPFQKWHGLGNDFVLIDDRSLTDEQVKQICDRRTGVGADGVLLVSRDPPRMVVRNADGSRPEMCGNGLRCVVGYLLGEQNQSVSLDVHTDAGVRACRLISSGTPSEVEVDMGRTTFKGEHRVNDTNHEVVFGLVDVGNPHAVTFSEWACERPSELGPKVEGQIVGGVNVEFCRVEPLADPTAPPRIRVDVWERGVGFTRACGTGACAVAAYACQLKLVAYDAPVDVLLPGGALRIVVGSDGRVTMTGPAAHVFSGQLLVGEGT